MRRREAAGRLGTARGVTPAAAGERETLPAASTPSVAGRLIAIESAFVETDTDGLR